jgi:hypothetical protein
VLGEHLDPRVGVGREDLGGVPVIGDVAHGGGKQQVGVAAQVAGGDHLVPAVVCVVEGEVMPPFVEGVTELRGSRAGLHLVLFRTQANRGIADRHRGQFGTGREPERAALVAELLLEDHSPRGALVRQMDPVVEPVEGAVHGVLRVAEGEAGEHHLPHLRAPVAVAVLEVEDVGRGGDEDPVLPAHHAGGHHQPVREDRASVRPSVAIRVLEELHAARGAGVERIAGHLDHEDAAVLVEVHRHRVRDVGLGRKQLDLETLLDPEGAEGLRGRQGFVLSLLPRARTAGHEGEQGERNRQLSHGSRPSRTRRIIRLVAHTMPPS